MESIRLFICALLLTPAVALAQAEEAAEEEVTVEEVAPAEEAAPTEEAAPAEEGMSADDTAAAQQDAGEESAEPAGPRGGHQVDVFYLPTTEIDVDGGFDERGDGAGARGLYRLGHRIGISGEYQSQKFGDNDEVELTQQRLGVGFVGDDDDGGFFGLFAEYDKLESDELGDLDGYSAHLRLGGRKFEWLAFYGDLGYLRLESDAEDYSGHELTLGAIFRIDDFGIFADARRTKLEGKDSGGRSALNDVRAGVRYEFGAIKP